MKPQIAEKCKTDVFFYFGSYLNISAIVCVFWYYALHQNRLKLLLKC